VKRLKKLPQAKKTQNFGSRSSKGSKLSRASSKSLLGSKYPEPAQKAHSVQNMLNQFKKLIRFKIS
jgi:hypothetical protein